MMRTNNCIVGKKRQIASLRQYYLWNRGHIDWGRAFAIRTIARLTLRQNIVVELASAVDLEHVALQRVTKWV